MHQRADTAEYVCQSHTVLHHFQAKLNDNVNGQVINLE